MHPLTRFRLFRTLAILAACQPTVSTAQTLVAAGDLTELQWTQAGSPYRILDGNVTVPPGATLTVEAGVRVEVGPGLLIFIEGALDAQGLAATPVVFTSSTESGSWVSMQFEAQSTGVLRHTVVERSLTLQSRASLLTIEDSIFRDNSWDMVVLKGRAEIRRSRFEGTSNSAILVAHPASLSLINSTVADKGSDGVYLRIDRDSEPSEIINSTFVGNGLGADAEAASVRVQTDATDAPAVVLRNAIIVNGGIGIAVEGEVGEGGRYIELGYSNVWNNVNDYFGSVVLGPGMLSVDPLLFGSNDFRLQPGSPSIDTGRSTDAMLSDIGGVPRPSGLGWDMGAHERPSSCGNRVVEFQESCDDGNDNDQDSCSNQCRPRNCGNGLFDPDDGEECDDGNASNHDGCSNTCRLPFCQDGFVNAPGEECDDGNQGNRDGCDNQCKRVAAPVARPEYDRGCTVRSVGGQRAAWSTCLALVMVLLWRRRP